MIAITGSTGYVGNRVAAGLAQLSFPLRLIVRDPKRAPVLPGAQVSQIASFGHTEEMKQALRGAKKLFLVSAHDQMEIARQCAIKKISPPAYNRIQQHISAVDAAAAAGVKHIVYLSFLNASPHSTFILAHDHLETEAYIRRLGIPFTFLRMNLFSDFVPVFVSRDGVIRGPAGNGRVSWVTRDDVAAVAVAVLSRGDHDGKTYDVTGPEAMTMAQAAEQLAIATGRNIRYESQTLDEARTRRTASGMDKYEAIRRKLTGRGLSDDEVEIWVTHYAQMAANELATVSHSVPDLTGKRAQTLSEFLKQHPESHRHLSHGDRLGH
jgi:uncharacterized protein YbjT (DUF2867 family)